MLNLTSLGLEKNGRIHMKLLLSLIILFSHTVYAKETGILLLKTYNSSQDVTGWLMSEKLDGVRAIWDGKMLKSRRGIPIDAPKWFLEALPPFSLDGELWTRRGDFENIVSIVRQQKADQRWQDIGYHVFELPHQQGGLLNRLAVLQNYLQHHPSRFIHVIPQSIVQSVDHLNAQLENVTANGGEGLVVRKPNVLYRAGRSNQSLKVKQYQDTECTVIAYKKGKGKYVGKTGSLHCQLPSGLKFYVGSGLSDQQRQSPPKIGSVITFKYYGLTNKKTPRFPVFLRVRQRK